MKDTLEIEIPEVIAEYLEAIPGNSSIGSDLSTDPDYFRLTMEIPKAVPDYRNWIEISGLLLREKSKDLRVASWLVLAFYRTEGIKGFKNGLLLLVHLLKKFGNDLFPLAIAQKSKAIQFISTDRLTKLLEKESVNKSNLADYTDCAKILSDINNECEKLFPANKPAFKSLADIIKSHIESANEANKTIDKPEKVEQKITERPSVVSTPKQSSPAPVSTMPPAISISSERDAVAQLRKTISYFFEYDEEGVKKQRVPENYFVFSVVCQMQWGSLARPTENGGVTLIEAPNKIIQGLIKDWYTKSNYDILISRIAGEFIKENSEFRYWLDAHKYLVQSLENKGGNYSIAAADIRLHLSKLLLRIPDFPQLKFKDKQTPFADEDTIKWLAENIKNISGSNGLSRNDVPPIITEDFKDINEEYLGMIKDSPESFERNLLQIQKGITSDDRIKGKFLRRLNLANFLIQHKEYQLAKVNLIELKEIIHSFNLAEWEQALCTAVWKTMYIANREIISQTKDHEIKIKLEKDQEELFHQIAKYDGVLAIKLIKQKK